MNSTVAQMDTYTRKGKPALDPLLRNVLPARWRVAAAIVCRARREAGHRVRTDPSSESASRGWHVTLALWDKRNSDPIAARRP